MPDQSEVAQLLEMLKRPPIPRDFAKLVPGSTGRMNPPQTVAYIELLTDWLNRSDRIPVRATLDKDGFNMTLHINVTIPELPAAPEPQ